MTSKLNRGFSSDTRHLWILLGLILAGGAGFLLLRSQMIPRCFGEHSAYRADALDEIAARPSMLFAESECLKCHVDVAQERAESLHKAVHCMHCHGLGRNHVAQAIKAVESPDSQVDPAKAWDRDFLTAIDLYVTKDRATCLVCHEDKVGMPKNFKKINVAEHLEEMGAEAPEKREACFECHGPHNTAP